MIITIFILASATFLRKQHILQIMSNVPKKWKGGNADPLPRSPKDRSQLPAPLVIVKLINISCATEICEVEKYWQQNGVSLRV